MSGKQQVTAEKARKIIKSTGDAVDCRTCIVHYDDCRDTDVRALTDTGFNAIYSAVVVRQSARKASQRLDTVCTGVPVIFDHLKHGAHRLCYSRFTHVKHIKKSTDDSSSFSTTKRATKKAPGAVTGGTSTKKPASGRASASSASKLASIETISLVFQNPECFFCGRGCRKRNGVMERLTKCEMKPFTNSIKEHATARKDVTMCKKIERVDLIGGEALYHQTCERAYTRPERKQRNGVEGTGDCSGERIAYRNAFNYISMYVKEHIIDGGGVYRMTMLREIYVQYIEQHTPKFYNANYATQKLKQKLMLHFGDKIKFWKPSQLSEFVYSSLLQTGIELRVKEAISQESCHKPFVTCDHRPKMSTLELTEKEKSSSKTGIDRPKHVSVLKAHQGWKEMLEMKSVNMDSDFVVDNNSSAQQAVVDHANNTGGLQADVDISDSGCSKQLTVPGSCSMSLIDMADGENEGCNDANWIPPELEEITKGSAISECIFHCSDTEHSGKIVSPSSMESWFTLLNAAKIWKYQKIIGLAGKIKSSNDLKSVRYHPKCRNLFSCKYTLAIIKCSKLNSGASLSSNSTNDFDHNEVNWNASSVGNITDSNAISKCLIHCSLSADEHDPLHSPLSMASWDTILRAARVWKYQRVVDIAEKIKTDADLQIVKYHSKCCKYFTMSSALEIRQHQELNACYSKDSFSSKGSVTNEKNDEYTNSDKHSAIWHTDDDDGDINWNPALTERPPSTENADCSTISENVSAFQNVRPVNMTCNKHLESTAVTLLQYRAEHFLCDALVMVDDGELQAHSVILSAASPVFKAAFTVPNVSHCVRVSDVNMDVMKLALDAIYTGQVDCDSSYRSDVTKLLLHLQVYTCNFEESEDYKMTADDIRVKRDNEEFFPCGNEQAIHFNSLEALDDEMANVAKEPALGMISQSLEEDTEANGQDHSGQDPMDTNQENDLARFTAELSSIEQDETVDYRCSALVPEQMLKLKEEYLTLCDMKQSLMLASLVELDNLTQPTQASSNKPGMGIHIVKYFLPLDETGQRVRVCETTFCKVFSIGKSQLYGHIFAGNKLIYESGKAVKSSPADNYTLNIKQEQGSDVSSLTALLLSADCHCKQCRGYYQCPYCDFKSSSKRARGIHVLKLCRNAQSHAATGGYGCDYCSTTCTTLQQMNEHVLSQHGRSSVKGPHICDICNKSYNKKSTLKQHRVLLHKGGLYLCQICGKNCNTKAKLLVHVMRHSRENIVQEFRCNLCPEKFKRRLMCIRHKEKVHDLIETRVSLFCDKCGRRFGGTGSLRYHQRLFCRERNKTDAT